MSARKGAFVGAAVLVTILHLAFAAFMLLAPFSNSKLLIVLHAIITPFILFHWICNDDTCFLTLVERYLRGIDDTETSFFHSIVSPIYKLPDIVVGRTVWIVTVLLGLLSWYRVHEMGGMMQALKEVNQNLLV